jgi:low temperature requirement protein LtrA
MTETDAPTRVSSLELFFDLVFVFTVTQVASIVEHEPSWRSTAQAILELLVIFWMYGGFAWLTNTIGAAMLKRRLLLLMGMAAFFLVSLCVPRAFDGDGIAFGLAYLLLNLVHITGFLMSGVPTKAILRLGGANLVAASLVLVAGFSHGDMHFVFWGAAVAVQWLGPRLLFGSANEFPIEVDHFSERHGLMILIVLGESLVSVAVAAQAEPVRLPLVVGALCGLLASAAMWWAYFDGEDEAAAAALRRRPPGQRGDQALLGYGLSHVVMMAGILSVAAGSRLSLPDLTSSTSLAAASYIAAGLSLFLVGAAVFRGLLGFANPAARIGAAVVAVGLIPVGTRLGAAQELAGGALVIAAMLGVERLGRLQHLALSPAR